MTKPIAFLVGCGGTLLLAAAYWVGREQGKATQSKASESRAATATETFNLRSRCAELGQKLMDGHVIGSALTQSQVSHYDPSSHRCYVRLDVMTADLTTPPDKAYNAAHLYDAQTGELLATVSNKQGTKSAQIFMDGWRDFARSLGMPKLGQNPVEKDYPEFDFVTVQGFIDGVMKEHR